MNRPYIICHMMTSVDGRIDCAMTERLPGVQEYYDTLDELGAPSRVSGRVTAQLEMSLPGEFHAGKNEPFGAEGFSKAASAEGYEIVMDTNGTMLWEDDTATRAARSGLDTTLSKKNKLSAPYRICTALLLYVSRRYGGVR